ncbi:MAG: hypothetical protein JSW48_15165 [Betaproteobacteria bacterium]|nr:MAG: hypothetical protein JSW48_15165 [Betaproteobacteria bacterium]
MSEKPSLMVRVAVGKAIGLAFGLAGFVFIVALYPETGWLTAWGILLWYTTVGAIIGVFGVFTYHPVLKMPLPWWFRAPMVGAWMNFVLTFFAYDVMEELMIAFFGANGVLASPFWFTLEGAIVGLVIGYFATRIGGEGKEAVGN